MLENYDTKKMKEKSEKSFKIKLEELFIQLNYFVVEHPHLYVFRCPLFHF